MSTQPTDPVLEITQSILTEAAQRPWLAALLMRHRPDWLTRLARLAQQVRSLPRHTRRVLRRKLAYGLAAAALLLALSGPPQTAQAAAPIDVTNGTSGLQTGDGCSLAEAIINANADAATWPDCIAGSGTDTINLQTNVTLPAMLTMISSDITIEGNGHTIDGADTYRVFGVRFDGNLTLKNATITHGRYIDGAGIFNGGTLTVLNSTISNNVAYDSDYGGNGGGIYNGGELTVTNSTIDHNAATYGSSGGYGGGLHLSGTGTVTITNSTINNNTADHVGGGLALVASSTVKIVNSTLSGNMSSGSGGGIYASIGDLTIQNSTIVDNISLDGRGGGIWILDAAATLTLERSIVSGNTASAGSEVYAASGIGGVYADAINLFGHSDETNEMAVYGFAPGASDIVATSDGGGTPTALTDILDITLANNGSQPHPFTHALVSGSPAIDKITPGSGDPLCKDDGSSVDERGGARAGGATKGGASCDIGAFEYDSTYTPNAVALRDLTAKTNSSPGMFGAIGAMLAALTALVIGRRARVKARP